MITSLTIDRKRWGTGNEGGMLRCPDNGKMCCLGFAARALGFSAKKITDQGMPCDLVTGTNKEENLRKLAGLVTYQGRNAKVATQLANVNDSTSNYFESKPERRETRIKQLFSKLGVKVSFVN